MNEFQPQVMAILGALLQYYRGFKSLPEWGYHVAAVGLATIGYVLFTDIGLGNWKTATVRAIIGISGLTVSVWGGTFVASNSAKAGLVVFPKTDSVEKK